ncbi:hypothetical protein C8F04DRAFT_1092347 [Mycena alexandri]|uniref:Uncharacterized protein n=1 Tax=Mycena alexandri TaxID=1745969 RepID=A0AAD6T120_9AGAR|nr:hypothetical protein C8F04DRAFT_1092347 [Mycena alexandri]
MYAFPSPPSFTQQRNQNQTPSPAPHEQQQHLFRARLTRRVDSRLDTTSALTSPTLAWIGTPLLGWHWPPRVGLTLAGFRFNHRQYYTVEASVVTQTRGHRVLLALCFKRLKHPLCSLLRLVLAFPFALTTPLHSTLNSLWSSTSASCFFYPEGRVGCTPPPSLARQMAEIHIAQVRVKIKSPMCKQLGPPGSSVVGAFSCYL